MMKKWYIYLISITIAIAVVGYFVSSSIHFSDEEIAVPTKVISTDVSLQTASVTVSDNDKPVPEDTVKAVSVPKSPDIVVSTPVPKETITVATTPYLPVEVVVTPEPAVSEGLPVISITDETKPETYTINNVVNLSGIIGTDSGYLTEVSAEISKDGIAVQSSKYSPFESVFSLAGTVNADLHFAQLGTGDYRYKLCASAQNNVGTNSVIITDVPFSVVSAGSMKVVESDANNSVYVAQISPDNDNAAIIWNFLISQFDNPYAVAGILANIEAESSLNPTASQGDTPACGYGLCQWTQDRKNRLNEFAALAGTDVSDIDLQLCFIIYELDYYYPHLKQFLCDVGDGNLAASEFCAVFEQSASYGNRGKYVSKYLQRFALTQ